MLPARGVDRAEEDWARLWRRAAVVHFFSSQTTRWRVTRDRRYEAYAVLGPDHCPLAYWGDDDF